MKCMQTNFGEQGFVGLKNFATFCMPSKTAKISLWTIDYSPWSSKNLIYRNRLKKFMHVGIDVKCIHTNFGGRDLFSFGDIATFKNSQFSLSDHGL